MKNNLNSILEKNKIYAAEFSNSKLLQIIQDNIMQNSESRSKLLSCIQVFSNYFQKTVMLRTALNENNQYLRIAREHLSEEFGHDISLMHDRHDKEAIWDPVLEACSSWFTWKMMTLDNIEKIVLIHLVLEASANIFFVKANQIMQHYSETNYFEIHAVVDFEHESMGLELLQDLREIDYKNLIRIQRQGWDVLHVACERM